MHFSTSSAEAANASLGIKCCLGGEATFHPGPLERVDKVPECRTAMGSGISLATGRGMSKGGVAVFRFMTCAGGCENRKLGGP